MAVTSSNPDTGAANADVGVSGPCSQSGLFHVAVVFTFFLVFFFLSFLSVMSLFLLLRWFVRVSGS